MQTLTESRREESYYQLFREQNTPSAVKVELNNEKSFPGQTTSDETEHDMSDLIDVAVEPVPIQNNQQLVEYPAKAKSSALEGRVTFSARIGKDGQVRKIVINKAGYNIFRQPLLDALKKVKFIPAKMEDGNPTMVWYTQSIVFILKSPPESIENGK